MPNAGDVKVNNRIPPAAVWERSINTRFHSRGRLVLAYVGLGSVGAGMSVCLGRSEGGSLWGNTELLLKNV